MSLIEAKREFSALPAPIGRSLPKYVHGSKNRHGTTVYYYRRDKKTPRIRVRGEPGTVEFFESYKAALNGTPTAVMSWVYFARSGTSRVKIGVSRNPKARLGSLRTGSSTKMRIYYVTPGDAKLERDLHGLFATDRLNGEWFIYSKQIRDWIVADEARRRQREHDAALQSPELARDKIRCSERARRKPQEGAH